MTGGTTSGVKSVTPRSGVYPITVNDEVFAIMVEAIAKLSLRRGCFVSLRDVVAFAMEGAPAPAAGLITTMNSISHIDGNRRIYLRLYQDQLAEVEEFKVRLSKPLGRDLTTRDMLCICCLLTIQELG